MYVTFIIAIIILIIFLDKYSSSNKMLKKENEKLKNYIEELNFQSTKQESKDEKYDDIILKETEGVISNYTANINLETVSPNIETAKLEQKTQVPKEKNVKKEDNKNTLILITGSVFIVLAALVFLTSTWNIVPNIVKTILITALIGVFFSASNIAQKVFKLKKASKAFYYIAMAYIPICLASIALFKLLGNYLSIYGEGKYVYLAISGILISIIYYIEFYKNKSKMLYVGSLLSQLFSVITIMFIFDNNLTRVFVGVLIYNIILISISKDKITKIYVEVITKVAFVAITLQLIGQISFYSTLGFALIALTEYLIYKRNTYKFDLCLVYICLIFLIFSFVNLEIFKFNLSMKILITILLTMIIFSLTNLSKINSDNSLIGNIILIITMFIVYIIVLLSKSIFIEPYMITIVLLGMFALLYQIKKCKKMLAVVISMLAVLTGYHIIIKLELSYHAYVIYSILIYLISLVNITKEKYIEKMFKIIGCSIIYITYIILILENFSEFMNDIVYFIVVLGIAVYEFIISKEKYAIIISKVSICLLTNIVLFSISYLIELKEVMIYIPLISTIILMNLELAVNKIKGLDMSVILGISQVVVFLLLLMDNKEISIVISILFAMYIFINNDLVIKRNKLYNIIPLISVLLTLLLKQLLAIPSEFLLGIFTILITIISLYKRDINLYTIFSVVYLIATCSEIENTYINTIIFIIWSVINYIIVEKEQIKDVFKFFIFSGIAYLYYIGMKELIEDYHSISLIVLPIYTIVIFKIILNKYINEISVLKYILLGLVYLIALCNYQSELDGMIFIISIIAIIIYSYNIKDGAIFLTSIIAIIVNGFILTREFWFIIPWWLYLLIIGVTLVGFAIYNETMEVNNKVTMQKIIDKVKFKNEH